MYVAFENPATKRLLDAESGEYAVADDDDTNEQGHRRARVKAPVGERLAERDGVYIDEREDGSDTPEADEADDGGVEYDDLTADDYEDADESDEDDRDDDESDSDTDDTDDTR